MQLDEFAQILLSHHRATSYEEVEALLTPMTFKEYYYSRCVVGCLAHLIHQHPPCPSVPLLRELWLIYYLGHRLLPLCRGHRPEHLMCAWGPHQESKQVIIGRLRAEEELEAAKKGGIEGAEVPEGRTGVPEVAEDVLRGGGEGGGEGEEEGGCRG